MGNCFVLFCICRNKEKEREREIEIYNLDWFWSVCLYSNSKNTKLVWGVKVYFNYTQIDGRTA